MALGESPRDIGLQMKPDKLESADSVQHLLDKLDEYKKMTDANEAFSAWQRVSSFFREENTSMDQYLVKREHAASEASKNDLNISNAIGAYLMLENVVLMHRRGRYFWLQLEAILV